MVDKKTGSDDSGLSTGAKAGTGVDAALLAFLLLAVGICLFRRKRRQARKSGQAGLERSRSERAYRDTKAELEGKSAGGLTQEVSELPDPKTQDAAPTHLPYSDSQSTGRQGWEADSTMLSAPPIPFTSKPRAELDEGYRGNETADSVPSGEGGSSSVAKSHLYTEISVLRDRDYCRCRPCTQINEVMSNTARLQPDQALYDPHSDSDLLPLAL